MTMSQTRANLWWRHEPFPGETTIALRPCAGKAGVAKGLGDARVSFHSTDIVNLAWWVRLWRKFTFNRAQDVVRKPLVYSAHCGTCWSQGSHSMILHVKYRAQFLLGVGWGGMSYWVYVTLSCHVMTSATAVPILFTSFLYRTNVYWSVIHGIKRKPHLSVVWNWYHFVAIAILHQPRPTDSVDINTRLQLSNNSSIPLMHGGFLLILSFLGVFL